MDLPEVLNHCSLNSSESINIDEPFPIMSISKSFLGVICSLMAAQGEFGEDLINAKLQDILAIAKRKYPDRSFEVDSLLTHLTHFSFFSTSKVLS